MNLRPGPSPLIGIILLATLLAGCTQPPDEPEPETVTFTLHHGRSLAGFADGAFNPNTEPNWTRHQSADFTLTNGTTTVAVWFSGELVADDARAVFRIQSGNGSADLRTRGEGPNITTHLALEARQGGTSDDGPIVNHFGFRRIIDLPHDAAHDQTYNVTASGTNQIGQLMFQITAIPDAPETQTRTVSVPSDTASVRLQLSRTGLGDHVDIRVIDPTGRHHEPSWEGDDSTGALVLASPEPGEHRIVSTAQGWAGTVGIRIETHPRA